MHALNPLDRELFEVESGTNFSYEGLHGRKLGQDLTSYISRKKAQKARILGWYDTKHNFQHI
jgi:hypothetical protein